MVAHSLLMFVKSRLGLLPSFQPYEALQEFLNRQIGVELDPIAAWVLSFISGATIVGFIFGRSYQRLPGKPVLPKAWSLASSLGFSWDRYSFRSLA